ncbi:MAG: hypothetical protein RBT63_11370, partial [Bdellovibrionales bacterium]|nr:hypothetical protein [Bdellovibrionales bacterium]
MTEAIEVQAVRVSGLPAIEVGESGELAQQSLARQSQEDLLFIHTVVRAAREQGEAWASSWSP